MRLKKRNETPDMFQSRLDQSLNPNHPLFKLANQINWSIFEKEFEKTYDENMDRPGR